MALQGVDKITDSLDDPVDGSVGVVVGHGDLCPAGGSVRLMVVGSAPVAPGILTFIRAALGT